MILRVVKMELIETKIGLFERFMSNLKDEKLRQEGCLHHDIFCDKDNNSIYFSYTIWNNEKSLKKYKKSELFKVVSQTIRSFCVKEPLAWTVENVFNSPYDDEE